MKKIMALMLITATLFAGCKKEDPDDNNNNNTAPGLEALADDDADSYAVMVVSFNNTQDTIIWQNTDGDVHINGGGAFGVGNKYYKYAAGRFTPAVIERFEAFQLNFRKRIPQLNGVPPCTDIDSIIRKGMVQVHEDYVFMSLDDPNGPSMSTDYISSPDGTLEVLSITRTEVGSGCYRLRVKARFTKIQFGPFACIVPSYTIEEGVVQMDYDLI